MDTFLICVQQFFFWPISRRQFHITVPRLSLIQLRYPSNLGCKIIYFFNYMFLYFNHTWLHFTFYLFEFISYNRTLYKLNNKLFKICNYDFEFWKPESLYHESTKTYQWFIVFPCSRKKYQTALFLCLLLFFNINIFLGWIQVVLYITTDFL